MKYKTFIELYPYMQYKSGVIRYGCYILANILLFMFFGTIMLIVSKYRGTEEKYPSSRYKKVIKKGFFWDSIEYHER